MKPLINTIRRPSRPGTLSRLRRPSRLIMALAFTALLFQGCGPKIYGPPHFGNMQLTLTGILAHCYTHVNGTARIGYHGAVQVYYFDSQGQNRMSGNSFTFSSPNNPATAVQLTIQVPDQGPNYQLEIIAYGDDCSLCTPDVISPTDSCLHAPDPSGGYRSAKPKFDYSYRYTSYKSSETIDVTNTPPNDISPNTCGCIVPN